MKRHNIVIQPVASVLLLLLLPSNGLSSVQLAESRFPANGISNPAADYVRTELNLTQASIHNPIRFIPPTAQAAPSRGRSRGGASRGNCATGDQPLTALVPSVPATNAEGEAASMIDSTPGTQSATAVSLTTVSHPTFWFYVPVSLTIDRPAEFLLLDEDGNYVYTALLSHTATAGIIHVTLPTTAPPLETGKTYRWIFQLTCETGELVDTWGEIQRVALTPDLQSKLAQSSIRDRSALYAAEGIWYDALTTLAELHLSEPTDAAIVADWQSLLQSANLSDVMTYPLLGCCQADDRSSNHPPTHPPIHFSQITW